MYNNGKHISIEPEVDIHMPDVRVHNKGESAVEIVLNPLTTTRIYSYTLFCRFLAVLEYSPIGVKFPPTIAWRILYTVKKKKLKIFKTFFVLCKKI